MNIILIYSGGLDSSALLIKLLAEQHSVKCLSIDYGQRHSVELTHAATICAALAVEHRIVDLRSVTPLLAGSSQTDTSVPVPHGHYAEENMKKTVVPNRNMIMLALAGAWAISTKADAVAYAAHAGDHTIYPDCREKFVKPLAEALRNADWHEVEILRPFLNLSKGGCVMAVKDLELSATIDVCEILAETWSCYEGGEVHCGQCGACTERREAFFEAGVTDKTTYKL